MYIGTFNEYIMGEKGEQRVESGLKIDDEWMYNIPSTDYMARCDVMTRAMAIIIIKLL